jgi:carbon storage regulator
MLVLSRRLNEKILFPGMRVSVQVVSLKPGAVRLGIEAPPEVAIWREEIHGGEIPKSLSEGHAARDSESATHLLRSRLKAVSIDLGMARLQLRTGCTQKVAGMLERIHDDIQGLRRELEAGVEKPLSRIRSDGANRVPATENDEERALLVGCLA